MKICFFADARNVHVQRLAPGLASRGHEVTIVCHKPPETPIAGVTVERFRVPRASLGNPRRWHRRWARYLRNFLRRFDVVVVYFLHDWGFKPEIIEAGCLIASPRGSDVVPPPGETPPGADLVERRIELLRHAALVGVAGPRFARIVSEFAGLERDRIDLLPLGVDLDLFRPSDSEPRVLTRAEAGLSKQRVGFFKGFREVYGAADLVRAIPRVVAQLPGTGFDLVGDGPRLAYCQELASECRAASSIRWIPRRPHAAIPMLLRAWDLTVMPSLCESFGLAALESSAMCVPVVASRVGGLPDTVRNGMTGLLVPPKSPEPLAAAIVDLLNDGPRRMRMGEAGREWVRRHYEWQRVLDTWIETLRHALDRVSVMV